MYLKPLKLASNAELKHLFNLFDDLSGGHAHTLLWRRQDDALKLTAASRIPQELLNQEAAIPIDEHSTNLISQTARLQQSQHSDTVNCENLFQTEKITQTLTGKAILTYPVVLQDYLVGVIGVFYDNNQSLPQKTQEHLNSLTKLVGTVIENLFLKMMSEKIIHLTNKLRSITTLDGVMQLVVNTAQKLTQSDSSVIFLFDSDNKTFSFGACIPSEDVSSGVPRENGLTRKILDEQILYEIQDASKDPSADKIIGSQHYQSIIGIRLESKHKKMGVFYVRKKQAHFFTHYDALVLKSLAALVSSALEGAHFFFKSSAEIEHATACIYDSTAQLEKITQKIKAKWAFDYVSIQLIRHGEATIETVHVDPPKDASELQQLSYQGKYSLHSESIPEIHAKIVQQKTKIIILSDWSELLDRWRYDINQHKDYISLWLPILVLRDNNGEIIYPCPSQYDEQSSGHEISLTLLFPETAYELEVIGTLEVGFLKQCTTLADDVVNIAFELFKHLMEHTADIRKTQLSYVLETVTKQAKKILNADSATLHYPFITEQKSFVTCSGANIQREFTPRKNGLGVLAIDEKQTKQLYGQNLHKINPKIYQIGIHAMAALPLHIGAESGVMYLHFLTERLLNLYEIAWCNLFAKQVSHAIHNMLDFMKTSFNRTLLNTLHVIYQLLINHPESGNLLLDIANIARGMLGADLISIYEYRKASKIILPPKRAGKLEHSPVAASEYGAFPPPRRLLEHNDSVYETDHDEPEYESIFCHSRNPRQTIIKREHIRSTAGILLKVEDETVGMMFIHYRYQHLFKDQEKGVLDMFALSASIAIKTKRAYQQICSDLKRREAELDALRSIDHALVNDNRTNVDYILSLILRNGEKITRAKSSSIYWYTEKYQKLELRSTSGVGGEKLPRTLSLTEGVIGKCATTKSSILVCDTQKEPWSNYYSPFISDMRSELAVPLIGEKGLLGVLNVEHDEINAFSKDDQALLTTFANQALIAVHGAEINEKLNNRYKSLKSLSIIALEILSRECSLDVMLQYILTGITAGEGLGFSRAMLFFLDDSDSQLCGQMAIGAQTSKQAEKYWDGSRASEIVTFEQVLEAAKNFRVKVQNHQQDDAPLSLAIKNITLKKTALTGALRQCVFNQDVVIVKNEQPDAFRNILQQVSTSNAEEMSFICVPLLGHQKTIGVLVADNRFLWNEPEANLDTDGLKAYANFAAMAVENTRLQEKLSREQNIASTKASIERMMHTLGQRIGYLDGTVYNLKNEFFHLSQTTPALSALTKATEGIWNTVASIKDDLDKYKFIGAQLKIKQWPIGLNHLLYALQQNYRELIEYHDNSDEPITFYGDEHYIRDALIELICNAKEAMKNSKSPKIIITLSQPTAEFWIYIEVVDSGPGIEHTKKKNLFDFYHSETANAKLGLTIVKEIIEAHGGTIQEIGLPNQGAHFRIKLPTAQIELSRISPYKVGGGITDASVFFGREPILSHIFNRPINNYFLVGARQLGKTSVLRAIERYYSHQPKISCAYLSLSGPDLLTPLTRILNLANTEQVWSFLSATTDDQQRLVLIDEADAFVSAEAEQGYPTLAKLRALSEQGHCHFMFAGFWSLYRITGLDYHSPMKNFGEILTLGALEPEACYQLATQPMAVMNIQYASEDIVESMIQQTGQRPNLIAILCNEILKRLELEKKIIEKHHLSDAIDSENINQALSGWQRMNGKDEAANRLDRIIVYLTIEKPYFTQRNLLQELESLKTHHQPEAITAALTRLKLAFILDLKAERYTYRVPLFQKKILAQGAGEMLKGELAALDVSQQQHD